MAERKPKLVMDIVAPPSASEEPKKKRTYLEILIARLRKIRIRFSKKVLCALGTLIIVVGVCSVLVALHPRHQRNVPDPVPLNVRKSVSFNIYFPDPAKLPAGYSLDTQSFSAGNNVLVYKIKHKGAQALIVTVQSKLSDAEMQQFYRVHMPLTIPIETSVGPASLGTLNDETVISLPTNTNAWLLMAAPLNADQKELDGVIKAMALAQ